MWKWKMLSEAPLHPVSMPHGRCFCGSAELAEICHRSQVHDGVLAALVPAAVGLQGDQRAEVQLRVSWGRQHRIRVSAASRRRPKLPNVAAAVVIWVGAHKHSPWLLSADTQSDGDVISYWLLLNNAQPLA